MAPSPGGVAVTVDLTTVDRVIREALDEDLGPERLDVTSVATIPASQVDTAELVARGSGVLAGSTVAARVFEAVGGRTTVVWKKRDGERVAGGDLVATVVGPTRGLLAAERTALNLLCRLSGIATHTRRWVDAVAGTGVSILDTRKTTPGLRELEKYAVRVGGGTNKRMGLYDVAMVKDNHVVAAGSITAAFGAVRAAFPAIRVEVEVASVAQAREAVDAGADYLLCDNMTPSLLREVVAAVGGRAALEATGGLALASARDYAATGVDFLSVGALTHSSPILDLALDLLS